MWKNNEGDFYIGEWAQGHLEGFGVLVTKVPKASRYEGQFRQSMKHGYGTERLDGETYTGEFFKNMRNGQGELYRKNTYYKGQFCNNLKHGKGYLKEPHCIY